MVQASFVQPGFAGELRGPSRAHVARRDAWIAASRGRRVLYMVAGLWIINAFDLVLTILAHRHHLLDETNPIAASLLPLGPAALLLYKTVLVTGASTVLILARRRILAEFASGTMLIVYALVAVQWKLCFEMYDLSCTNGAEIGRVCDPAGWTSYLPF